VPRRSRARTLLAAALVLLGVGVVVALAWSARGGPGARDEASPQDPTGPVELGWPADVARARKAAELADVPRDVTHLDVAFALGEAGDLSRFTELRHLGVHLRPATLAKAIMADEVPSPRDQLGALATAPRLRVLTVTGMVVTDEGLAALRHLEQLQALELRSLFVPTDELRKAVVRGGAAIARPFEAAFGAAVAANSSARTLRLAEMPIRAEGLRALADAGLRSLAIDAPQQTTADELLALGELRTLRHLELRSVHGVEVADTGGAGLANTGSRALSVDVLRRIGELPELRSLTLDMCLLDDALIDALPRGLQRLDVATCIGCGERLVAAVAQMPALHEVGLPLAMQAGRDHMSMLRPPIADDDVQRRRLSERQAAAIVGDRVWRWLRLDGRLSQPVADALSAQPELRELVLTPTAGSVSLAFVAHLPKLERVTFAQAALAGVTLAPLGDCASLQVVRFEDCGDATRQSGVTDGLREGVVVQRRTRMVW